MLSNVQLKSMLKEFKSQHGYLFVKSFDNAEEFYNYVQDLPNQKKRYSLKSANCPINGWGYAITYFGI